MFHMKRETDLSDYLFLRIIVLSMLLSVLSIIGNVIFGFPAAINIKWLFLLGVTAFILWILQKDVNRRFWKLLFMVFILYCFMPFAWFDSGGSSNNSIAYFFLIMISSTFFFIGKTRLFMILSEIGVFSVLLTVEFLYPDLFKQYDPTTQFFDRIFQIPLTLFAGFIFLRFFANAYTKEREHLNQIIKYDTLTNLYNRRFFDHYLTNLLKEEKQKTRDIYLIFFDIDDFKKINDENGHHHGDQVLKELASYTTATMSVRDIVARWGGDEFAVIFYGDEQTLIKKLTQLHRFPKGISTGATRIRKDDRSIETLLKRADKASYKAKATGKGTFYIL